jgi:hypothetical protein
MNFRREDRRRVKLWIYNRERISAQILGIRNDDFIVFLSLFQANTGIVPQLRPLLFPSNPFHSSHIYERIIRRCVM